MWGVIEHVSYDGQGNVSPALSRAGLRSVTFRPFLDDELPSVGDLSGLIVLGAPTGSADDDLPGFLLRERYLIVGAVQRGLPVLGVCFGAQLVAVALGGRVIKDGPAELGMGTSRLTPAGQIDPPEGALTGGGELLSAPEFSSAADETEQPCRRFAAAGATRPLLVPFG